MLFLSIERKRPIMQKRSDVEQRAWNLMTKSIGIYNCSFGDVVKSFIIGIMFGFALLLACKATAGPAEHKFKSPSFNGQNTSSHYLTIENQESTRKRQNAQDAEDAIRDAEREAENTTLARFLRNFESRVYSTLSRQLVESMFGENPSSTGTFELDGVGISYVNNGDFVELTITDENGVTTVVSIPVGDFGI